MRFIEINAVDKETEEITELSLNTDLIVWLEILREGTGTIIMLNQIGAIKVAETRQQILNKIALAEKI